MPTFTHPSGNGYTETPGGTFVLILLFGAFYLLYKRAWMAAILTLLIGHPVVVVLTFFAGASQNMAAVVVVFALGACVCASAMVPSVERIYRKRGWRKIG